MTKAQRIATIRAQMTRALEEGKLEVWRDLFEGLSILLRS